MRRKIVGASWKMHVNTLNDGVQLAKKIHEKVGHIKKVDFFILPTFPLIEPVAKIFQPGEIRWGAQNMCSERKGAYTGEVPAAMLKELQCEYVELAHAERKQFFNETDLAVNKKLRLCEEVGLKPVVCVGETSDDFAKGQEKSAIRTQIETMFTGLTPSFVANAIVAYEPTWAIGQAETASIEYIETMHQYIRHTIEALFNTQVSQGIRIIYGGSVNHEISDDIFSLSNVDGVFIGRFGLNADNFERITESALKQY